MNNKKIFLNIAVTSTIALTGVGFISEIQPSIHASTKSFDKKVKGQWTSQNGEKLKIDNSNATLKIKNGSNKGIYKFKVKKHNGSHYVMKAVGKKLHNVKDYSIDISNEVITFKFDNQSLQFNKGNKSKQDTSEQAVVAPTAQKQTHLTTNQQTNQNNAGPVQTPATSQPTQSQTQAEKDAEHDSKLQPNTCEPTSAQLHQRISELQEDPNGYSPYYGKSNSDVAADLTNQLNQ